MRACVFAISFSYVQVMGWVSEKTKVAMDESYRDPTNLQGKIQKHQAYEAELTSNRKRIDVVSEVSNNNNNNVLLDART